MNMSLFKNYLFFILFSKHPLGQDDSELVTYHLHLLSVGLTGWELSVLASMLPPGLHPQISFFLSFWDRVLLYSPVYWVLGLCVWVWPVSVYVHHVHSVPMEARRGYWVPQNWGSCGCKLLCGYWEPNPRWAWMSEWSQAVLGRGLLKWSQFICTAVSGNTPCLMLGPGVFIASAFIASK